jgi:hypothetical protein
MSLVQGFVSWFLDTFGSWSPPSVLTTGRSGLVSVMSNFVGLGVWVDFTVVGTCFGVAIATFLVVFAIKGARWVWGITPFSGGS